MQLIAQSATQPAIDLPIRLGIHRSTFVSGSGLSRLPGGAISLAHGLLAVDWPGAEICDGAVMVSCPIGWNERPLL